jgi:hypothetical protein
MKDSISIALLAVIAGLLTYHTFFQGAHDGGSPAMGTTNASGSSSVVADQTAQQPRQPERNTFDPLTPPSAPPVDNGPKTTIGFAKDEHDFGKVKQDSENAYTFKFTNTGTIPLTITNAQGSCGCTVPDYPKQPIAPGATGEINVVYKPGKQQGNQAKTVTVTANTEPTQTILRIKADVQVDPNAPKVEGAAGH